MSDLRWHLRAGDVLSSAMMNSLLRFLAPVFLLLTACNLGAAESVAAFPTATTVRVEVETLVPTVVRQVQAVQPVITQTPLPTPAPTAIPACTLPADQAAVSHKIQAQLDYAGQMVVAQQHIHHINRSNEVLNEVVLNIEANLWPDAFHLQSVTFGPIAIPVSYELTGRRLTVTLPEALAPACALDLQLGFRLDVPLMGTGVSAYRGYLGHSPRQLNLGHWLPTIAYHQDGEWITREAVFIGEQVVQEVADWDVSLSVSNAPEGLIVVGPGEVLQAGPQTWHFMVQGARDFTLSMSDAYRVISTETDSGVTVEVYTFEDAVVSLENGNRVDGADDALLYASRSLAMFEDLYGPYPYGRLAVVQADFPDGMEFSGVIFVGGSWFTRYPGSAASYLMLITVHEVAHQWWYAVVGSDQATSPWLDEALATYHEYVFIEEYYPDLKDWWWQFRVNYYAPSGFVDSSVYEFGNVREYINAVYLLGARMLHEVRQTIGTDEFFAWLADYVQAGQGRIVNADLLWSLLTEEQRETTQAIREQYLRTFIQPE